MSCMGVMHGCHAWVSEKEHITCSCVYYMCMDSAIHHQYK